MGIRTALRRVARWTRRALRLGDAANDKRFHELNFWRERKAIEGTLDHSLYEQMFTEFFGLERSFYRGKRLLDIGCGPRGSLEWADDAIERIGVDPLVDDYRELGIGSHQMTYECAPAEALPFPSGHFDVVSSLNSLDHVDDLDRTLAEIHRVLRGEGSFLLIVEVGHDPSPTEPVSLAWDIVDRLRSDYQVLTEHHYEMSTPLVHWSVGEAVPFDHARAPSKRPGVLVAHFKKLPSTARV